jgi:SAM-dependent methyltransferase
VLDLGCGHGWYTEQLRARGADVVGVDGSERLLAIARERYPLCTFVHADLAVGLPDHLGAFDLVVALMVLMDLPDLSRVRPLLTPTGSLVATILHPSFFLQSPVDDVDAGERYRKVTGYLDQVEWWITSFGGHRHYHRPLGSYVDWIASLGLGVTELFEPPLPRDGDTDYDRWVARIPTRLGLAASHVVSA